MPIEQIPYPDNLDYSRQAVEVPGTKRPGQTAHLRNGVWGLFDIDSPGVLSTLSQVFEEGLTKSLDKPMLGFRPVTSTNPLTYAKSFKWTTYREVAEKRKNIGSGIEELFKEGKAKAGDLETVGIWSQNRPEWQMIDLALHAYGKVGVSLYDTLGPNAVEYIIQHAELSIIFAAGPHVPTLLSIANKLPTLKIIVSIDELDVQSKRILQIWGKERNVQIMELHEVEELGRGHPHEFVPAKPNQIASICYTSGTTSTPKGAILTHGSLAISAFACIHGAQWKDTGVLLSYLPLAHIYERICELVTIALGGQIGYFTGDPLRLLEDAQILRPTYFPSVPRVLNRVYATAMMAGNVPGLKGNLFRKACAVKIKRLHETGENTHAFWDKLVFRKVQAALGGRVETLTSGSAPITPDAMDFLRIAFACDVIEGYGMTENCGTCTRVYSKDPKSSGTVGSPQPSIEMKLVDVPSMGYYSTDVPNARGEICCKGPGCFNEYYKDAKNTTETIDSEGWLHTGDVAELDADGRFKIIDRIKNIMKLAQGEYVALEKIENLYSTCPVVAQIYVHGESLQDYLLAVVIPDPPTFAKLASSVVGKVISETDTATLNELLADKRMARAVLEELNKEAKKAGLKGFEMVKRVYLTNESLTVENGLMTPTFKIKRKDAANHFKSQLSALYALGSVQSDMSKL